VPWKRKRDQPSPPPFPQSVSISGIRNSQVAVGTGNYTVQGSYIESGAAAAQLDQALATVRYLVQVQAGGQAQSALSQIDVLDRAVKDDPPDVTAIVRVRDWFGRHLPLIVPAVLEILAHPTIDTAIKAAGQVAQSEAACRSATVDEPAWSSTDLPLMHAMRVVVRRLWHASSAATS
jgi:hypothetical protein